MTTTELRQIEAALCKGETPEQIARRMGMTRAGLHHKLTMVGKRILITRNLADLPPVKPFAKKVGKQKAPVAAGAAPIIE